MKAMKSYKMSTKTKIYLCNMIHYMVDSYYEIGSALKLCIPYTTIMYIVESFNEKSLWTFIF